MGFPPAPRGSPGTETAAVVVVEMEAEAEEEGSAARWGAAAAEKGWVCTLCMVCR